MLELTSLSNGVVPDMNSCKQKAKRWCRKKEFEKVGWIVMTYDVITYALKERLR